MMTKEQVKVFNDLLNTDGFKGKEMLERLLWVNTNVPKYKAGDCFRVSDRGMRIFGQPVRDFKARIIKAFWQKIGNLQYRYEMEMVVRLGEKEIVTKVYQDEPQLSCCARCEDNINVLHTGDEDKTEEIWI